MTIKTGCDRIAFLIRAKIGRFQPNFAKKERLIVLLVFSLAVGFEALALPSLPATRLNKITQLCQMLLAKFESSPDLQEVPLAELSSRFPFSDSDIVGYGRNSLGKIVAHTDENSTGNPVLQSVRRGRPSSFWNAKREIRVLELQKISTYRSQIFKTQDWDVLPKDFQQILSSSSVLVTSGPSTATNSNDPTFKVLMAVNVAHRDGRPKIGGRTGVLLRSLPVMIDGEWRDQLLPIVLRDKTTGHEFLLEIKGVGHPEGGYDQAYNLALRGGVVRAEGNREFRNIRNFGKKLDANGVRTAGMVRFSLSRTGEAQDYLLRLTPGSIRLSFRDHPSITSSEEMDIKAVTSFAKLWGKLLASGMVLNSHTENLVVGEGGSTYYLTDFADLYAIKDLPIMGDGRPIDLRTALFSALYFVEDIPTNDPENLSHHQRLETVFRETAVTELERSGAISNQLSALLLQSADLRSFIELLNIELGK